MINEEKKVFLSCISDSAVFTGVRKSHLTDESRALNHSAVMNDVVNIDTPELRKFWVFPAYSGVQIDFTVKIS